MATLTHTITNNPNPRKIPAYVDLGTTIMAMEFADGVVFAADSRTSAGSFIVNRVTDKLTKITDNIYCCRSGSAADTQAIANYVKANLEMLEIEMGRTPTVKDAAMAFRQYCYEYRDRLMAGIIVAGWDSVLGGQVYSIPLGGLVKRQSIAIGGSGSTWIYGHIDNTWKDGMSKDECLQYARQAVTLAVGRDSSSGGCIRLAAITEKGVERQCIEGNKIPLINNVPL